MSSLINLSPEHLNEIEQFSYNLLKLKEIAIILQLDPEEFTKQALEEGTPIYQAIQKGNLRAKADVHNAVIRAAVVGSTPAITSAMQLIRESEIDQDFNQ